MIPMYKPMLNSVIAEINGTLDDPIAREYLGYGDLEGRKKLYEHFRGKCFVGAMEGSQ